MKSKWRVLIGVATAAIALILIARIQGDAPLEGEEGRNLSKKRSSDAAWRSRKSEQSPSSSRGFLEPLQGTWKSDKLATIEELRKHDHWTPRRLSMIEEILGKTTVAFKGATMHSKYENLEYHGVPTVTELQNGQIRIEYTDETFGEQVVVLQLEGNAMWVTWPESEIPIRERFVRIKAQRDAGGNRD